MAGAWGATYEMLFFCEDAATNKRYADGHLCVSGLGLLLLNWTFKLEAVSLLYTGQQWRACCAVVIILRLTFMMYVIPMHLRGALIREHVRLGLPCLWSFHRQRTDWMLMSRESRRIVTRTDGARKTVHRSIAWTMNTIIYNILDISVRFPAGS